MALKAGYVGVKRWLYEKLQATTSKNVQDISNIRSEQAILGARNLNATDYSKSSTLTNIVPTFNSDGSITVNGTTTAAETLAGGSGANFTAWYGGSVRIGEAPANVTMALYDATAGSNAGTAGQTVTMIAGHAYRLSITFAANKTFTNVTVNPLIVIASDPTTEPSAFAMTNQQLTDVTYKNCGNLTSSNNLNDVTQPGFYGVTTAPTNSPESQTYYFLLVMKRSDGAIQQIVFKGATIYSRGASGSPLSWGSWYKITGSAVTPSSKAPADDPELSVEEPETVTKTTRKSTKKEDN